MKTEILAAATLAGVFSMTSTSSADQKQNLTPHQKDSIAIQTTCRQLNDKFLGHQDSYAIHRIKGCQMVLQTLKAAMK